MTKDISDRNALAATWLELRIRALIKETEREFGVYVAIRKLTTGAGHIDDTHHVDFLATVWPESMRLIETAEWSKAIG